ncbi:MAG: RNA polymerase sigma factor [Lysobacteraceae bacterium]|nr:MAG: RNA polymerase sigma factor [Xanthomonadaceae bacterium]
MIEKVQTVEHDSGDSADSDALLVKLACRGDRRAYETLYRRNIGRVYALCIRLNNGNREQAELHAQDAFVRAWEKLPTFRGDAQFSTWLHRLTVNLVLGDKRAQKRRMKFEQPEQEPDRHGDTDRGSVRKRMDLEWAISELPHRARQVLVLHDVEGYKHHEIADMIGMAVGTSKAQLHRARRLLRECLA